jgi:endonuclease/exonuclease/phosphatase family metal-dependent hydrolase
MPLKVVTFNTFSATGMAGRLNRAATLDAAFASYFNDGVDVLCLQEFHSHRSGLFFLTIFKILALLLDMLQWPTLVRVLDYLIVFEAGCVPQFIRPYVTATTNHQAAPIAAAKRAGFTHAVGASMPTQLFSNFGCLIVSRHPLSPGLVVPTPHRPLATAALVVRDGVAHRKDDNHSSISLTGDAFHVVGCVLATLHHPSLGAVWFVAPHLVPSLPQTDLPYKGVNLLNTLKGVRTVDCRQASLERIVEVVEIARAHVRTTAVDEPPLVVAGDFNICLRIDEFKRMQSFLSGALDVVPLRPVGRRANAVTDDDGGCIDHIFVSRRVASLKGWQRRNVNAGSGRAPPRDMNDDDDDDSDGDEERWVRSTINAEFSFPRLKYGSDHFAVCAELDW